MILDTNAVSALLSGDPELGHVLANEDKHHLPVIVIGEYWFGIAGSLQRNRLNSIFQKLIRESFVLNVDQGTGETYAQIRFDLKEKGRPLPDNDIWIAALARRHDIRIVSRDVHFDDVDGVRRVSW